MDKYELLTALYDPNVRIIWRDRPVPFVVSIYMLKPGAGEIIGRLFPDKTGMERTREILRISDTITGAITAVADNEAAMNAFKAECISELEGAFPDGMGPTAKDIYDYSNRFTQKLLARNIMLSQEKVNDVIRQLLDAGTI